MNQVGVFRSSALVDVINYVGVPLLAVYGISMFAFPWIVGLGSWEHVQVVWDRWQTLNAGALAFAASLVAFNISRFNEDRQREREFVAAKAFLPSTLSGLMNYFASSASIYMSLWDSGGHTAGTVNHPEFPAGYREVFSNCIRHADPKVGTYLSDILVRLQVHDARLQDIVARPSMSRIRVVGRHELISYVFHLGQLYALTSNLFAFARGEEDFEARRLSWEDFRTAYGVLHLETDRFVIDERMNLQAVTRRWLQRNEDAVSTGAK